MSYSNQVSFLPEEFVKAKSRRQTRLLIVTASLAVAIGIAAGTFFGMQKFHRLEARTTPASTPAMSAAPIAPPTYAVESRLIEQVRQPGEEPRKAATPLVAITMPTVELDKVPLSRLLSEVNGALPPGVSLLDLTLESKRTTTPTTNTDGAATAPANETVAYAVTIEISGLAQSDVQVAQFINRLGKSPVLKNLNLLTSEQAPAVDQKPRHFHLELGLDPTIDPQNETKPIATTAAVDPSTK